MGKSKRGARTLLERFFDFLLSRSVYHWLLSVELLLVSSGRRTSKLHRKKLDKIERKSLMKLYPSALLYGDRWCCLTLPKKKKNMIAHHISSNGFWGWVRSVTQRTERHQAFVKWKQHITLTQEIKHLPKIYMFRADLGLMHQCFETHFIPSHHISLPSLIRKAWKGKKTEIEKQMITRAICVLFVLIYWLFLSLSCSIIRKVVIGRVDRLGWQQRKRTRTSLAGAKQRFDGNRRSWTVTRYRWPLHPHFSWINHKLHENSELFDCHSQLSYSHQNDDVHRQHESSQRKRKRVKEIMKSTDGTQRVEKKKKKCIKIYRKMMMKRSNET